ncbi:hypothetical protein ScPMuIL_000800 [Solemya velum]
MEVIKLLFFFLLQSQLIGEKRCFGARTQVDLNLSSGSSDPTAFWPISEDTHGDDGEPNRLYANLYNISLMNGPTNNLTSMNFTGQSGSYVHIPNDGTLNGNQAFSWMFYLYFDVPQNSTLLEYSGTNNRNGISVDLVGNSLAVSIYDSNGVHVADYTSYVWVAEKEWTYVGISYNMHWGLVDIYLYFKDDEDTNMDLDTYFLPETNVEINALGDVWFGAGEPGSRFLGRMSCMQFYDMSVTDVFQRETWDNCNSWSSFTADRTRDMVHTTASTMVMHSTVDRFATQEDDTTTNNQPTSTTSQEPTTNNQPTTSQESTTNNQPTTSQESTTNNQPTTSQKTTTDNEPTTNSGLITSNEPTPGIEPTPDSTQLNPASTNAEQTSTDVVSTTAAFITEIANVETTLISIGQANGDFNNIGSCYWFSTVQDDVMFTGATIETEIVSDLGACAKKCQLLGGCSAFVAEMSLIHKLPGTCSVVQTSYSLAGQPGYRSTPKDGLSSSTQQLSEWRNRVRSGRLFVTASQTTPVHVVVNDESKVLEIVRNTVHCVCNRFRKLLSTKSICPEARLLDLDTMTDMTMSGLVKICVISQGYSKSSQPGLLMTVDDKGATGSTATENILGGVCPTISTRNVNTLRPVGELEEITNKGTGLQWNLHGHCACNRLRASGK